MKKKYHQNQLLTTLHIRYSEHTKKNKQSITVSYHSTIQKVIFK